jgi:hypothetical protein
MGKTNFMSTFIDASNIQLFLHQQEQDGSTRNGVRIQPECEGGLDLALSLSLVCFSKSGSLGNEVTNQNGQLVERVALVSRLHASLCAKPSSQRFI